MPTISIAPAAISSAPGPSSDLSIITTGSRPVRPTPCLILSQGQTQSPSQMGRYRLSPIQTRALLQRFRLPAQHHRLLPLQIRLALTLTLAMRLRTKLTPTRPNPHPTTLNPAKPEPNLRPRPGGISSGRARWRASFCLARLVSGCCGVGGLKASPADDGDPLRRCCAVRTAQRAILHRAGF
jgi:hypothetical protein